MGFDDPNYNVVTHSLVGKTERVVQALANIAATLGKLSMDACLFSIRILDSSVFRTN
jgi:argininosuccinate lyase